MCVILRTKTADATKKNLSVVMQAENVKRTAAENALKTKKMTGIVICVIKISVSA